jgi:predicted RNA-binding protein with PIN domain
VETIIIDAYNLMHKVPELEILLRQNQDACVDAMIAKLQSHYGNKKIKAVLVFDGMGKNKSSGNIEIKFSKTNVGIDYGNADKLIKALIEKAKNKKLVMVISSDNDIAWFAKECGCKTQSSESFWGEIKGRRKQVKSLTQEPGEKPDVVSRSEYDFLLKEFTKKN